MYTMAIISNNDHAKLEYMKNLLYITKTPKKILKHQKL